MGIAVEDVSITMQWILQINVVLLKESADLLEQFKRTKYRYGQCAVECFPVFLKGIVLHARRRQIQAFEANHT